MDNNKIGKFIASRRKKKGLTQQELGDKLFVTDKAVSKWERGLSFPDIELLIPIAELFSVSVLELLNGQKNQNTNLNKNENEIVIETLNSSKYIYKKIFKFPIWLKIIIIIILIWFTMFFIDSFLIFKCFSKPIFTINTHSKNIENDGANYTEKEYVGLGYNFKTRGQYINNKYSILYCEMKIGNVKVKDSFKGVKE